jgi:hypothetical protein
MKYVLTEINSQGEESVVKEFIDLNEAMRASTKLRRMIPDDWMVQIYEKKDYLRMRKYLKRRDEHGWSTSK